MLVSIIISNYNYGRYLAQAIDSALRQSCADKEVIVVDDGSTDNSRSIIESYGDRIVKMYQSRGGHCSAVNSGFSVCSGDVIAFLDSDDFYIDENSLQHLVRPLADDPSLVKSQGYLQVVDSYGEPTGARIPAYCDPTGDYRELTLRCGLGVFRNAWTSGNAWSRWYLERVMPIPEHSEHGADGFLNAVAPLFGPLHSTGRAVVGYRVHGSNLGPISATFEVESLRRRVEEAERNRRYLVEWASKLGCPVATDEWRTWSWRHALRTHVLALMGDAEPIEYRDLVSAPFKTYHTGAIKRIGVSALLSLVWRLPRPAALRLARRMLGLPLPRPKPERTEPEEHPGGAAVSTVAQQQTGSVSDHAQMERVRSRSKGSHGR